MKDSVLLVSHWFLSFQTLIDPKAVSYPLPADWLDFGTASICVLVPSLKSHKQPNTVSLLNASIKGQIMDISTP